MELPPKIEIGQILQMIGSDGFTPEVKGLYGRWLDQEQALVKTSADSARLNIIMADVYLATGDAEGALESLEQTIDQVGQEIDETQKTNSDRYSNLAERDIASQVFKALYNEIAEKIENIKKMTKK